MQTYILLLGWTDQGIRAVGDSPKRLDAARTLLAGLGGKLGDFYLTMGAHDMVAIAQAPDDAAIARFVLTLCRTGSVRCQTLKAFPEAEYRQVIGALG